jgi:hypothetical protein
MTLRKASGKFLWTRGSGSIPYLDLRRKGLFTEVPRRGVLGSWLLKGTPLTVAPPNVNHG